MNIVSAGHMTESHVDGLQILKAIELAGRTCYKSEHLITEDSYLTFANKIIENGHHSVLEHCSISVRFFTDRGISHEIVRHRIASYSQESTRYCNYSKDKFGGSISVINIRDHCKTTKGFDEWVQAMIDAEKHYFAMIEAGETAQIARSVLPVSTKTEIVMTCNIREWRHFLTLRTSSKAHPQMREIAIPLLEEFRKRIPILFDDIGA